MPDNSFSRMPFSQKTAYSRNNPESNIFPSPVQVARAPTTSDTNYALGQVWIDTSSSPADSYEYVGGGVWDSGGNSVATTSETGVVQLATLAQLQAGTAPDDYYVPSSNDVATVIAGVVVGAVPAATETVQGIAELATAAETIAYTDSTRIVTAVNLGLAFASPPAIGGTSEQAGTFSTLDATAAVDFDVGGTWDSNGTDIDIGTAADTDAINIGTGAAARNITLGNVTGATAVAVNTGTGHFTVTTTGAGDIILNSDDTVLIDADGVLELNSSGGVIGIGNDADAQNINIGTGAAARTITVGNGTGATSLVLDCGTGALNIGTNAIAHTVTIGNGTGATSVVIESGTGAINVGANAVAHTITIGNVTGATGIAMNVGTGNFALDGVAGSTYAIGASTTTGTITIGGTAQTGTLGLGVSSGIMTTNLSTGNGAKTLNVATGVDGNTVNLATGVNTSAQVINVSSGASAANSTVNILSGNGTAGTQTLNVLTGTRAGALNLATGAAAHVITIGGTSAGAIVINSASTINIGDTASGAVVINSVSTIDIGDSASGALTLNSGGAIAIGDATAGAVTIDSGAGFSIDGATASNVTCAAGDLTVAATTGSLVLNAEEAVDDAIQLTSAAGGLSASVALSAVIASTETNADSVQLTSAGGMDITATGAAAKDLDIVCTSGSVNITAGEADSAAVVIQASNAAGGVQILSGTGGIVLGGGLNLAVTARATAGGTYTCDNDDFLIDTDSTGGAFQINLPAAPSTGDTFLIYDGAGQAAIGGNVTISGNGNNIAAGGASAATYVLNTAYESLQVTYNGTLWMGRAVV